MEVAQAAGDVALQSKMDAIRDATLAEKNSMVARMAAIRDERSNVQDALEAARIALLRSDLYRAAADLPRDVAEPLSSITAADACAD